MSYATEKRLIFKIDRDINLLRLSLFSEANVSEWHIRLFIIQFFQKL